MIDYLILFVVILAFVLASIEDLKKREVYDYLNFFLAFFVIVMAIVDSMMQSSSEPIGLVTFGMLIGFAFGALLYYMGIWGGGDAKFLVGFGAATYYLKDLMAVGTYPSEIVAIMLSGIQIGASYFTEYLLWYVVFFDVLFLIILGLMIFARKDKEIRQGLMMVFSTLLFLLLGLMTQLDGVYLIIVGFVAFLIIFFGPETMFQSAYIRFDKKIKDLGEGTIPDKDIVVDKEVVVSYIDSQFGLNKEQLHKLEKLDKKHKSSTILARYVLPFSVLITLNFVVYIFKLLALSQSQLEMLLFLLLFLFLSFVIGGAFSLALILFVYVQKRKHLSLNLSVLELSISGIVIALSLIFGMVVGVRFLLLGLLPILYLFVKIAREVEQFLFVSKKPLKDIVLGDWIAQDIEVDKKLVYSKDDFRLGIDEYQLEKIKKLAKSHKSLNHILVKDGIAFIPALFAGFIILFFL